MHIKMPHLSSYLHAFFFGMQMWHLPSLPYIYSSVQVCFGGFVVRILLRPHKACLPN